MSDKEEDSGKSNGHGGGNAEDECGEEPCREIRVTPLGPKRISATMETNDRLTPQNCVVQPLLTGT